MTRGVSMNDIFDTLQINLGSLYVDQFNKFGRVYQVYVQAEQDARADEADVGRLQVRNKDGQMIYLNAFVDDPPDGRALQHPALRHVPLGRDQRRPGAGLQLGPGGRGDGGARRHGAAGRLRLPVDRRRLPAEEGRQPRAADLRALPGGGVPGAGGALRELGDAGDHPSGDPARPARRGRCLDPARPRSRRLRPDRPRDADRPGGQELDPDRRVRPATSAGEGPASWRRR